MNEYVLQLIFAAGIAIGFVAGLITALVVLSLHLMHTEAQDEGPMQAVENAALFGYGILRRDENGVLEALSPSDWAIRRRARR